MSCLVFQRTPSTVDERNNKPTDPGVGGVARTGLAEEAEGKLHPDRVRGCPNDEDLVNDRWTDVWGRLWTKRYLPGCREDPGQLYQMADYVKMNEIRARIDTIVTDSSTAEALKPWYNLFCKRPTYSDEFLQVFNQPNVHLINTDGRGVDRITEKGVVANGTEYEVDCLIYSTGFSASLPPFQAGDYQVVGRGGQDLGEHWADGCKSVHGIMTHGFPTCSSTGTRAGRA